MRLNALWLLVVLITGCATAPRTQISRDDFQSPPEALLTQRGVLTVKSPLGRKQFTVNGYLAHSSTRGQRLIITENFGNTLADVLITADGKAHVMRSSRAFKPEWIERYIAADVRCLFSQGVAGDCPGQTLGPNHFLIERRWYKLDLQTVNIRSETQPAALFDPSPAERR